MACWILPVVARFPMVTRIVERSADWEVAESGRKILRGFQSRQFRFEIKAQLRALLFREPIGHLRKDSAVERDRRWFPRQFLRCAGLGKNLFEPTPHLVGIGAIGGLGLDAEQVGLFGVMAKFGSVRSYSGADNVGVAEENRQEWRSMCSPSDSLWTV